MANYKDIHGTQIETVSSDPDNPVNGQVWYNSAEQKLKGLKSNPAGTWSSGGNMNTARWVGANGAGTQTAGLVYGGEIPGSPATENKTESYNGSSWTETGDLNTRRRAGSAGGDASTSALYSTGSYPGGSTANVESFDGSSWTELANVNTARQYGAAGHSSGTAGLIFGGFGPPTVYPNTESFNGSSWTEVNDLNTGRRSVAGNGAPTAAICMGGYPSLANTEIWDGTSWTEVADQSNGGGGASFGTSTSALKNNGTTSEVWNGTAWSSGTSSSNDLGNRAGLGTTSLGLLASGESPYSTATEEYVSPTETTVTFDVS